MSYDRLIEISNDLIADASKYVYIRSELALLLEPNNYVTILKGARGIGKSTLLQQFLLNKKTGGFNVFYLSADSTLLTLSLAELAYEYYKRGGEYLAIDEIHKYANWQTEIKTILDAFPRLKLIVSGSSSINLNYHVSDLSRRHVMLHAKGLSFREYINKNYKLDFKKYLLTDILNNANIITTEITKIFRLKKLDLLKIFKLYLKKGYFLTVDNYVNENIYYDSLLNAINSIIDADLSSVYPEIDNLAQQKIKRLLKHIAAKCPFVPNISELSKSLNIANDNSLKKYLYYLHIGEVIINLYAADKSHKDFPKPQKILLNNPNFAYAYSKEPLIGTIRETFVANCLQSQGILTAPSFGDFCLDNNYIFEVGGKSKTYKQIKSIKNSYVLADDILLVEHGNIPLWLLGFLW